jgi:hypothetical protein
MYWAKQKLLEITNISRRTKVYYKYTFCNFNWHIVKYEYRYIVELC